MATRKFLASESNIAHYENLCVRVGIKIRELRKKRGWTQQILADHSQIERSHLARLEEGKREAGILILQKIADALEIPVWELLR